MQSGHLMRLLQPSALIMIAGIFISGWIQLHFLNLGMRHYDVRTLPPSLFPPKFYGCVRI